MQLKAEDLVRGYGVDVSTNGGAFQKLGLRNSRVYCPGANISFVLSDEGYVKASAASSPPLAPSELDLHQAVFGWEGWSLAAQRPGRAIAAAPDLTDPTLQDEQAVPPLNSAAPGFPSVQITVRPQAATLPRLRFGTSYSFRARIIDLAGNDISVSGASVASPAATYLRYEPVPNPVLVLEKPLTEGEHVERLVIRSNPYGAKPEDAVAYAAAPPATPMNPYGATSARWIAPPKGAWSTAEMHGSFDALYTEMSNAMKAAKPVAGVGYVDPTFLAAKSALYTISQKESGTFSDTTVWNSSTASLVSNPVVPVTPPSAKDLPLPTTRGNPLSPGQYTTLTPTPASPNVFLPYLPDANAAGVLLQQILPSGALGSSWKRSWALYAGCAWPEIDLPQIVLQQGTAFSISGTDPAASNAPIVVSLPPGQRVDLQYSSTLVDVTKMANSDVGTATGDIPTYAPSRVLTCIHAVQQPAFPGTPAIDTKLAQTRAPGQTTAPLTGTIAVDGATTAQLDLVASWEEYLDVEPGPGVEQGVFGERKMAKTGRVNTWTLAPTDTSVAPAGLLHEFGDTKTRLVVYGAVATSRYPRIRSRPGSSRTRRASRMPTRPRPVRSGSRPPRAPPRRRSSTSSPPTNGAPPRRRRPPRA